LQVPHLTKPLQIEGIRDHQVTLIENFVRQEDRLRPIIKFRREIKRFLREVNEKEQPFGRIYDLVQDVRRHRGIDLDFDVRVEVFQVRNRLLTTVLLIRCDYTILLTFLNDLKERFNSSPHGVKVDLSRNREDCERLLAESRSRSQLGITVECHLYWARFVALERSFVESSPELTELLDKVQEHLQLAHRICDVNPGQTAGVKAEVKDVEIMLRGSTFYLSVSNQEKAAVYAAMAQDFQGTGHWYYCRNGRLFTVGECGRPMQTSQCPQCGSPVGGQSHRSVDGVRPAADFEQQFHRIQI